MVARNGSAGSSSSPAKHSRTSCPASLVGGWPSWPPGLVGLRCKVCCCGLRQCAAPWRSRWLSSRCRTRCCATGSGHSSTIFRFDKICAAITSASRLAAVVIGQRGWPPLKQAGSSRMGARRSNDAARAWPPARRPTARWAAVLLIWFTQQRQRSMEARERRTHCIEQLPGDLLRQFDCATQTWL